MELLDSPAPHAMQDEAPSPLFSPMPQSVQLWLAIIEYVPAAQSVVADAPVTLTKVPADASLHSLWPCWFV